MKTTRPMGIGCLAVRAGEVVDFLPISVRKPFTASTTSR